MRMTTLFYFMAQAQNFADLLKDQVLKIPQLGEVIKGKVISLSNGAVRIDVNGLMTGIIRGKELFAESNEYTNIKVGDEVEATVVEQENEAGEMELSFRIAGKERVWNRMEQFMKDGVSLKAKVVQANKGGLMMQVEALGGFMPVSQLSPDHYPRVPGGDKNRIFEHLQMLIGKEFTVKVIDVDQKEEKLIVSEKEVWEDDQKAVLDSYKIGDVVEGEISALTSFGAFLKFGQGLEGLIHISEIVWQRIDHPKDVLKVGDRVKAQIIDLNKSKIYLSVKRLVDDPWKHVKEKYAVGQVVEGLVHKVEPFGLMVKLDDQIHGLAHISELSDAPMGDIKDVREKFPIGSKYRFEVMNVDPAEHRLGLKLEGVKGKVFRKKPETTEVKEEPSEPKAEAAQE